MILTVCTRAHLARALALGASVRQHHTDQRFIIGLADEQMGMPITEPHTLLMLDATGLTPDQLSKLSGRYTPTEFCAAVKPGFIRTAFERFPDEETLLYFSPTTLIYQPLTSIFNTLVNHTILLNPHWLTPPADALEPDEKHLQNVGLYTSGCIGFRRDTETTRMLDWWQARCLGHAAINFCVGSCLDGLWLMHVPTLFSGVGILKNTAVQVALWNLPQRRLSQTTQGWMVQETATKTLLLTVDFLGLAAKEEGLFQHQTRFRLAPRPDVRRLIDEYRNTLIATWSSFPLPLSQPTYGTQPEPVIRTGWRRTAHIRLTQLSKWINTVSVKPVHR